MKVINNQFVINKKDLKRKVVLIKGHKNEAELNQAQMAAMSSIKDSLSFDIANFEKYNNFRVKNHYKPLNIDKVLVLDLKAMIKDEVEKK